MQRLMRQSMSSRRRVEIFYGMHSGERTLAQTEQNSTEKQNLLGETTGRKSQDRERGGTNGKIKTV